MPKVGLPLGAAGIDPNGTGSARMDKRADDYVAGVESKAPVGYKFDDMDFHQQAELIEFAKTRGVTEQQVQDNYFNHAPALDNAQGYGAAGIRLIEQNKSNLPGKTLSSPDQPVGPWRRIKNLYKSIWRVIQNLKILCIVKALKIEKEQKCFPA